MIKKQDGKTHVARLVFIPLSDPFPLSSRILIYLSCMNPFSVYFLYDVRISGAIRRGFSVQSMHVRRLASDGSMDDVEY